MDVNGKRVSTKSWTTESFFRPGGSAGGTTTPEQRKALHEFVTNNFVENCSC